MGMDDTHCVVVSLHQACDFSEDSDTCRLRCAFWGAGLLTAFSNHESEPGRPWLQQRLQYQGDKEPEKCGMKMRGAGGFHFTEQCFSTWVGIASPQEGGDELGPRVLTKTETLQLLSPH